MAWLARAHSPFEKIAFRYEHTEVLHEISLTLNQGEIVGLPGPNGAGNTTAPKILKIIAGSGVPALK